MIYLYFYMLLLRCLQIVKKMCMVRLLIIDIELSTAGYFNVKIMNRVNTL